MHPLSRSDLQHVFDHTRELWDRLRGKRLFITGGTGFFGNWLLETFIFANDALTLQAELVVLTRSPELFIQKAPHLATHPAIRLLQGDVRNFEFPDGPFSYVIHGGTTSGLSVPPLEMFDTVVDGTRRVLDFAVFKKIDQLLLISSGAVYGKQPSELTRIPENWLGAPDLSEPNAAYAEGKRAAELLCHIYYRSYGLETKIARCFSFLGPLFPITAHFAAGNFIRDALAGGLIRVSGDGTPLRSYLYTADLAIWLWTILFKGQSDVPYNVGSEEEITIAVLAKKVLEISGLGSEVLIAHQPDPQAAPLRYVPDCSNARKIGLQCWIPLEEQIRRTLLSHVC